MFFSILSVGFALAASDQLDRVTLKGGQEVTVNTTVVACEASQSGPTERKVFTYVGTYDERSSDLVFSNSPLVSGRLAGRAAELMAKCFTEGYDCHEVARVMREAYYTRENVVVLGQLRGFDIFLVPYIVIHGVRAKLP